MYSILTIGKKVKKLREKNNLTQVEFAFMLDLSPTYVSYLEKGLKSMSLETLIKVANIFKITADTLLSDCLDNNQSIGNKEMVEILNGCTVYESRIIVENAKSLKEILIESRGIKKSSN